jgi:flagellar basal body-associated protein FliL
MAEDRSSEALLTEAALPEQKKRHGKVLVAGAVLFLCAGFGAWWFAFPRSVSTAVSLQPGARVVLPMESFTVNLADPEEGRFLRTTISLGVEGELPQMARAENKGVESGPVSMATIRDSILTVLAQCKSDELLMPEGKANLKAKIISALNRDVPALGVREVYFTEFLVQR